MYGFAPVILLILLNGRSNKFLVLALCFIVPSVVEYISLIFLVDVAFTTFQWRGKGELYNHS